MPVKCNKIDEVDVMQSFRLEFEIRVEGVLTDPDTLNLYVSGGGFTTVTTIPVVNTTGTGLFYVDVTPTDDGVLYWIFRASGVSVQPCADKGTVSVIPTAFEVP